MNEIRNTMYVSQQGQFKSTEKENQQTTHPPRFFDVSNQQHKNQKTEKQNDEFER